MQLFYPKIFRLQWLLKLRGSISFQVFPKGAYFMLESRYSAFGTLYTPGKCISLFSYFAIVTYVLNIVSPNSRLNCRGKCWFGFRLVKGVKKDLAKEGLPQHHQLLFKKLKLISKRKRRKFRIHCLKEDHAVMESVSQKTIRCRGLQDKRHQLIN